VYWNGTTYEGTWDKDKPHGQGVYYEDLSIYKGNFHQGLYHGEGLLKAKSGELVEGVWELGVLKEGKVLFSENDERKEFLGMFKEKCMSTGTLTYKDGRVMELSNNARPKCNPSRG
jgi:hypothetical protein